MAIFRRLNQERGATVVVVTHDPLVARATQRRVTLRDGKVVGDDPIADPATEDLREFARSTLGRQIAEGDTQALEQLGLKRNYSIPLDALAETLSRLR